MKIIVHNLALEYQDEGAGETLLLLHGWQDSLHTFDALARLLSRSYRVVRLDLPGFGESELPKEPWSLDQYVSCVDAFITKLGLSVDVLVGHSFGGRIAIQGSATETLKPKKLILIGSAGLAHRNTARSTALKFLAKVGNVVSYIPPLLFWRKALRKKLYTAIGSDYLDAGALKETYLTIISEDLTAHAEKIQTPTLLIWGEHDTATPLADGERFARLIQGARLEVVSGAGHFVHKEKPEEVAQLMHTFL